MKKQTLNKQPETARSNDLVYFLASLCLFIIMALLATDSNVLFR
ncbi:MAG: hypothetical protein R2867_12065 [Caldilineaceae bacterium]